MSVSKEYVSNNNSVLLLKRTKQTTYYWDAPGGRIDAQESLDETLKRELLEEIGVAEVSIGHLFTIYRLPDDVEYEHGLLLVFYSVKLKTNKVVLSNEHEDFRWVSLSDMEHFLANESGHINEGTKRAIRLSKD